MPKIPDCDHCRFYAHDPHLVCAVHPTGVSGNCLDFRQDPNSRAGEEEKWSPLGYYWWDGVQLAILDSHPIFTGRCPKCGYEFDCTNPPLIYWDCPSCGWIDDSV